MTDAIFVPDGDLFVPTDLASSPWGPGLLHGGPPAGLLAHAIEKENRDPGLQLSRLTIDLFRPVPKQPLGTDVRVLREGKRIRVTEAALIADGQEVCRATALFLRTSELEVPEGNRAAGPTIAGPEGIETAGLGQVLSGMKATPEQSAAFMRLKGFHTMVEVRGVDVAPGSGRGTAWIRIPVPFVAGEATTPLVRVAATSDFGNALGNMRLTDGMGFINADITLYLGRMPEGEWIGLQSHSVAQPSGLGMGESVVHDLKGVVGRVVQALIVNPRAK
jgi:acyl-CoA thioesterase